MHQLLKIITVLILISVTLAGCTFKNLFYDTRFEKILEPKVQEDEKMYEFELTNSKKKTIHTAFVKNRYQKPVASVFILHGEKGSVASWLKTSPMYTSEAYNFYVLDFQGFGESDGSPSHKKNIEDAQMAFEHFLKLEEVQGTRIVVHGISTGGHTAINLASANQSKIDVLVLEETYSSPKEHVKLNAQGIQKPFTFLAKDYLPGSIAIKNVTTPTLIMASKQDKFIPYSASTTLYNNSGAEQKELWDIGGEHLKGMFIKRTMYMEKLAKLLAL